MTPFSSVAGRSCALDKCLWSSSRSMFCQRCPPPMATSGGSSPLMQGTGGFFPGGLGPLRDWRRVCRGDRPAACEAAGRTSARQRAPLHLRSPTGAAPGSLELVDLSPGDCRLYPSFQLVALLTGPFLFGSKLYLVGGRPQIASGAMVPCFWGPRPQLFEGLRAGRGVP